MGERIVNTQTKKKNKSRYNPPMCNDNMTFQECELAVLRQAVDESGEKQGAKIATSPDVQKIIKILEDFLVNKKLICYGGTAINNILPKEAQFYDRDIEVPDYDFYSPRAMEDSRELSDIYYREGYGDVEAKAGVHLGTYKVYVNFLPIADITQMHPTLYDALKLETITIAGIKYAPPNYLRMSMYLELSRPEGDVSRWEKVLKRINLLNKYHPLKSDNCSSVDFQRGLDLKTNQSDEESIYYLARDSFIDQGVVFLGGYGTALYSKYMENDQQHQVDKIPDFDVIDENPEKCAMIVRDKFADAGYKNVKIVRHTPLGEVIPMHVEISVNGDIIAFIYKPLACHGYNKIEVNGKTVMVATIDTMLSFYLAFLYADKSYFDKDRMLCMSTYLFEVEQRNKLEQKGLLKRFSLDCYGKQPTMEEMREDKARKYTELDGSKNPADKKEFDRWFFKYSPANDSKWKGKNNKPKEDVKRESITPTKTIVLQNNVQTLRRTDAPRVLRSAKRQRNKEFEDSISEAEERMGRSKKRFPKKRSTRRKGGPYAKRTFYFGKRK